MRIANVILQQRHNARRRGIIAFTVLVMLSILVLTSLSMAREVGLEAKAAHNRNDVRQALLAAQTGIDYCVYAGRKFSDWREKFGSGAWLTDYAVGTGTVTVKAAAADGGSLAGDPLGRVEFKAYGKAGLAQRTMTACAEPLPGPAQKFALCSLSKKGISLRNGISVYGDLFSAGDIDADRDVKLFGNAYVPDRTDVSRDLFDDDTAVKNTDKEIDTPRFDWLIRNTSQLDLPWHGKEMKLENAVLTAEANPFGKRHPEGLYLIDARKKELVIANCYIIGSLIVVNAKKVIITDACILKPSVPKYPTLVCDDELRVELARNLQESDVSADLNGDGDTMDHFVSRLSGILYSDKKIIGFQKDGAAGPFYIHGAVVAPEIELSGEGCHVSYDENLAEEPIVGFQDSALQLVPGALRY